MLFFCAGACHSLGIGPMLCCLLYVWIKIGNNSDGLFLGHTGQARIAVNNESCLRTEMWVVSFDAGTNFYKFVQKWSNTTDTALNGACTCFPSCEWSWMVCLVSSFLVMPPLSQPLQMHANRQKALGQVLWKFKELLLFFFFGQIQIGLVQRRLLYINHNWDLSLRLIWLCCCLDR